MPIVYRLIVGLLVYRFINYFPSLFQILVAEKIDLDKSTVPIQESDMTAVAVVDENDSTGPDRVGVVLTSEKNEVEKTSFQNANDDNVNSLRDRDTETADNVKGIVDESDSRNGNIPDTEDLKEPCKGSEQEVQKKESDEDIGTTIDEKNIRNESDSDTNVLEVNSNIERGVKDEKIAKDIGETVNKVDPDRLLYKD